jgi:hypothetical protein
MFSSWKLRTAVDQIRPKEPAWKQVPSCTLSQYREIVKELPRPSNAHIENFVLAASEDHSWYKHLPLVPPGVPWWFFVDPWSGFDRTLQEGGRAAHVELMGDETTLGRRLPTKEYRSSFGYLACVTTGWGGFSPPVGEDGRSMARIWFGGRDTVFRVPVEIEEAGRVEVTAVVHPETAQPWVWSRRFPKETRGWPVETGGDETLREVLSHCERKMQEGGEGIAGFDEKLIALLKPEMRRLHEAMKAAIRRMLSVAYD